MDGRATVEIIWFGAKGGSGRGDVLLVRALEGATMVKEHWDLVRWSGVEERGLAVARWWNIFQAFEKWWAVVNEKVISSRVQATTSPGERKDIMEWRGRLEIIWVYTVRRSTSGYAIVFRSSREMYAESRPHFLPTSRGEFSKANVNKKKRGRIWRCNLELYLAAWL